MVGRAGEAGTVNALDGVFRRDLEEDGVTNESSASSDCDRKIALKTDLQETISVRKMSLLAK